MVNYLYIINHEIEHKILHPTAMHGNTDTYWQKNRKMHKISISENRNWAGRASMSIKLIKSTNKILSSQTINKVEAMWGSIESPEN